MTQGYFITGTDTGVGKTMVTAALLRLMRRRNLTPGVMKPFECGVDPECHSAANSDACFLMEIGEIKDDPETVCPIRFKTPAAPLQAASLEKRSIEWERVQSAYGCLTAAHDWILVEGAGGLLVPLTENKTVADLALEMQLPVIIVTRYQLGTLNHTALTVEVARQRGLQVTGLIFNQTQPGPLSAIESEQPALLNDMTDAPVIGEMPWLETVSPEGMDDLWESGLETRWNLDLLFPQSQGGAG